MTCQIHPTHIKVIQDSLGSWIERCEFQESRSNGFWISCQWNVDFGFNRYRGFGLLELNSEFQSQGFRNPDNLKWGERAFHLLHFCRLYLLQRVIYPLNEWEILREQIEYEGELGRGAFGVVYKAILRERVGIEVFNTEVSKRTVLSSKKEPKVVAVKVLHGKISNGNKTEWSPIWSSHTSDKTKSDDRVARV